MEGHWPEGGKAGEGRSPNIDPRKTQVQLTRIKACEQYAKEHFGGGKT